jgi:hypothetical protein
LREVYPLLLSKEQFREKATMARQKQKEMSGELDAECSDKQAVPLSSLTEADRVMWIHDRAMYFPTWLKAHILETNGGVDVKDLTMHWKSFLEKQRDCAQAE